MSETKIKTKKKVNKMAIAVVTLSLALIAAIGGIFGVYAALQQNVNTTFSVQYSIGKNVAAAVGVAVRENANDPPISYFTCSNSSISTIPEDSHLYELSATSNNLNATLVGADTTMERATQSIDIGFYFKNLSNEKAMTVTLTDNVEPVNMWLEYVGGYQSSTTYFDLNAFEDYWTAEETNVITVTVAAGQMYCIVIALHCSEANKSASFISTAEKGVSFAIESAS